jgi:hypothetical protein
MLRRMVGAVESAVQLSIQQVSRETLLTMGQKDFFAEVIPDEIRPRCQFVT